MTRLGEELYKLTKFKRILKADVQTKENSWHGNVGLTYKTGTEKNTLPSKTFDFTSYVEIGRR